MGMRWPANSAGLSANGKWPMPGIGHFPFAENPALFAEYLLPILEHLKDSAA